MSLLFGSPERTRFLGREAMRSMSTKACWMTWTSWSHFDAKRCSEYATAFKISLRSDYVFNVCWFAKEFEEICLQLSCMPSESLQKTWSNFGRLNTVEIQSMSGPSVSRCFRVWDVCVSIFFFMSIHVTRHISSLLAFPRMKPANWLNPIFAWELILFFPFATCHCDLDQGVDADPAKSWGPWKHAVWRTEDIAEASNLVDLSSHLLIIFAQGWTNQWQKRPMPLLKVFVNLFFGLQSVANSKSLTHVTVTSCHL